MNNNAQIEIDENYLYNLYKAESTLWYFNGLIQNNFSGYNAVKFKNEKGTYVWLENVKISEGYYFGNLAEQNVSCKIAIVDIIDWMIIENGRLIGGYTIRHYRDTLDTEDKINFDIDFGVIIDDGNDFFYPDDSTAEGVLIALENFYTEKSLDGILSCKNFEAEAKNLLLETGNELTSEMLYETAELLKVSLIENINHYGFPDFSNVERLFSIIKVNKKEEQKLIKEKLNFQDGSCKFNKFWIGKQKDEKWKVLNLLENG